MNYSSKSMPGLSDPYWYEWTIGLHYIVEMLNPDSEIDYVEFQADVALGIDDIVVTYKNGLKSFFQVKNTRTNEPITMPRSSAAAAEHRSSEK